MKSFFVLYNISFPHIQTHSLHCDYSLPYAIVITSLSQPFKLHYISNRLNYVPLSRDESCILQHLHYYNSCYLSTRLQLVETCMRAITWMHCSRWLALLKPLLKSLTMLFVTTLNLIQQHSESPIICLRLTFSVLLVGGCLRVVHGVGGHHPLNALFNVNIWSPAFHFYAAMFMLFKLRQQIFITYSWKSEQLLHPHSFMSLLCSSLKLSAISSFHKFCFFRD